MFGIEWAAAGAQEEFMAEALGLEGCVRFLAGLQTLSFTYQIRAGSTGGGGRGGAP